MPHSSVLDPNSPESKRLKGLNFSKRLYLPRVAGLGLGSICVASSLYEQQASFSWWAVLFFVAFIWPHLAYFRVQKHPKPRQAELDNFLIDSFFGAMWLPVISFNILPSAIIVAMLSFDNLASGGPKLFSKGLVAQACGIALGIGLYGFNITDTTSQLQIYACLPMLIVYPLFLGYLTHSLSTRLSDQNRKLKHLSVTDGLTQTFNRRHWESLVQAEFLRANRAKLCSSILMLDLDDFKLINDKYGHLVGDKALQLVASTIKDNIRRSDFLGRYGGEEFGILLTDTTPECTLKLANKLRRAVERIDLIDLCPSPLSVSVGISTIHPQMADYSQWMNAADMALYQAKNNGKNQCIDANSQLMQL
ncbi:diguanylate cyclase [Catenovulum sp. SM1970]|uniref:diguanylate cyclase n=1 Tax=Marinifaba aquimaris TaxID=2741323 RepID=UPI001571C144|nr:diguanylate cyclase [Marinifaba aquimaris]NTS78353.1 diguanylate cyclase [Marinifaba aquimaris]